MRPPNAQSAVSWLRETDTLEANTLKRAYWEDLRVAGYQHGLVTVTNHSHLEPEDHAHVVGVNQHGIVHHCSCKHYEFSGVCKHMVYTAMQIDAGSLDLSAVGCKEDVIARAEPQA